MRINRFSVLALLLVTALSFPLVGCKGSSNSASSKGEATKTTEAAKPKEPETRVNNTTDADVEFVSLDKDGITLKLSVNNQNLVFFPMSVEVAGSKYNVYDADGNLNPAVHFTVDGKDTFQVELKEGESRQVRVSVDGVTDYSQFRMNVDDTIYDISGKSWQIKDVAVEVITK